MANLVTSGTFTATQSVIDILNASLRIAQVIGAEETATGAQLQNGLDAMTAMCKGWQGSGIHVWREEEAILFLEPNQPLYGIGITSTDHCALWDDTTIANLSASANSGATSISVSSISGINSGDQIGLQLSTG